MAHSADIPPPLELLCLKALWSLQEGNVKAVRQALAERKALAYTTVMTVLDRLARKGVVSRRKVGRAFVYVPLTSRDVIRQIALRDFLDTYFEGSEEALRDFLDGRQPRSRTGDESRPEIRLDTALL